MINKDLRGEINFFRIPVDENTYSTLPTGTADFPIHLSYDDLTDYENCFVNWHMQNCIEISIVTDGALHVFLPGYEQIFRTGDAFVIFPDQLHSIKKLDGEACAYRTLLFLPEFLYGFRGSYWDTAFYRPLIDKGIAVSGFFVKDRSSLLQELWPLLDRETENLDPQEQMRLQQNLQTIWTKLYSEELRQDILPDTTDDRIRRILHFLHVHYAEKFSLDLLASKIGLSRSECCRYFKRKMNMTIGDYLTEYRIGEAMTLLEKTSLSVTEIAVETGFSGASAFAKSFREHTSMTPTAYRADAKKRRSIPNRQ